jgi:ankyrin repeat protein
MKLLLTTIGAVVLVGTSFAGPIHDAAKRGDLARVELFIANGADVNAKDGIGKTPLDRAIRNDETETADLLRKHGGKTSEELKAEGK